MTRKILVVLALSVGIPALAVAASPVPAAAARATVGDFAVQLATAVGYDAVDARQAAAALKRRGVTFAADLSAGLTEGEAARILSDLGMAVVAPANPATPVSQARVGSLLAAIPTSVSVEGLAPEDEGPTHCLSSQNRGECNKCCKEATGLEGKFCGHFCHANVAPPPSPEEPTP